MDLVSELLKTVILTGKVANPEMRPVSLLLISPPEHGKTSIVIKHRCKALIALSDLTGRGVRDIAERMQDDVTHIAILDLLMATSHRSTVNQYLMAWINTVSEEGYFGEATPGGTRTRDTPLFKGFVCCLTPCMNRDGRHYWNKIGFTSRMLPFFYEHSSTLTKAIKHRINNPPSFDPDSKNIDLKDFDVPRTSQYVYFAEERVKEVAWLAEITARQLEDPKGYRRLKQFRALACAHALFRCIRDGEAPIEGMGASVELADVEFLKTILPYVSYRTGHEL